LRSTGTSSAKSLLDKSDYLTCLADNIAQFREAAELGLEPRVESCPKWTVGELVVHLANVYDFWAKIVSQAAADEEVVNAIEAERKPVLDQVSKPEFYASPRSLEYFDEKARDIQSALAMAESSQGNWTWWPGNQTAGFVQRRMCHETTIHRWDCQRAHGVQTPIAPSFIASDGIDEELNNELTGWGDEGKTFPQASFHLHCTDTEGEWLVLARGDAVELRREHAKADLAVTGEASNLVLWLWGRIPPDSLTVYGDPSLLPQLRGMLEQD